MLQRQHARLLAQLAPGGVAYWSCDVRQELVIGKLSSAETQRLGKRTAEFLRKFDWEHVLPGERDGAVGSGEFAASITALIGRGVLPAPIEIEIIEFMIQQAQSINPAVTESLLEEGLASSFENYLLAKDPPRHWLWHLDPSLFYRGGVHRVESWLLGVNPENQQA